MIRPEVSDQAAQRLVGEPEVGRALLEGALLDEVGPQRFILALRGAGGMEEVVAAAGIVHVPGSVVRVDFSERAGLRSY